MPGLPFADLRPGDPLPSLVCVPTTEQLVRYAGAANDYARIHYDHGYALQRGFPGVIVHGLLKAGLLARLVTSWCGPGAWVSRFAATYRGTAAPAAPLVCRAVLTGTRTEGGTGLVELRLWTEQPAGNGQAKVTTEATATVRMPLEEGAASALTGDAPAPHDPDPPPAASSDDAPNGGPR